MPILGPETGIVGIPSYSINISLVGSAQNIAEAPGSSIAVNKPAGVVPGDKLILSIQTRNSLVVSPPSGFTLIGNSYGILETSIVTPISGHDEQWAVYEKTATGSEPASYTFSITDVGIDGASVIISAWRGVGSATAGGHTATTTVTGPTAAVGDVVMAYNGTSFDPDASTTIPAGFTEIEQGYNAGVDVGACWAYKNIISDGAVGSIAWPATWGDFNLACYVHLVPST